jgi:hypothetical protein|tara:strand:- start:959 stop:1318 length:360 start_codon:yes stop_codon:yes gene_type:complete
MGRLKRNQLQEASFKKKRNVWIIFGISFLLEGLVAWGMAELMVIGMVKGITVPAANMVRMAFGVLFIFTFGLTATIAKNFASTVGMHLQDYGKAGLKAVRGEIDQILDDEADDEEEEEL